MATRTDVNRIVTAISAQVTEDNITHICVSTPNEFDIDAVIAELSLKDKKITAADVVKTIKSSPPKKPEPCGKCWTPYGIPLLDKHVHREAQACGRGEYEWLTIPCVYVPCPNCSGTNRAAVLTERMSTEEATWTWLLLYDYFIHRLQQNTAPEKFNVADYWQLEITPELTAHQLQIANRIYAASNNRGAVPQPQNIINKLTQAVLKPVPSAQQDVIPF
ncbi:MAG TPA: hypothetical protein PKI15_10730 [Candidatus Cloacimonadota bacterium]|nr:hypothetical protein [Candidatus Cloacimonadota bacterium]